MVTMAYDSPSSTSPVTITVSTSASGSLSIGLTSPVPRRLSNSNHLNSPQSNRRASRGAAAEVECVAYTVHIPRTPDHQIISESQEDGDEGAIPIQNRISNTIYTGGFNSETKSHVQMRSQEKPPLVGKSKMMCAMPGCDERLQLDKGLKTRCQCGFRICNFCYLDCYKTGEGYCPGCKEPYGEDDEFDEDVGSPSEEKDQANSLPRSRGVKLDKRFSLVQSFKAAPNHEFDHNRWLFETKGTYGYGNAVWSSEGSDCGSGFASPPKYNDRKNRPLTRKMPVRTAILSPYRLIMFFRFAALCFFLKWRISNPNRDAMWLWVPSVVCEFWFALSWVLDQLPKLCPVNRVTDLKVLSERFEPSNVNLPNHKGFSDLPGIDIFVSTADPEKEPPLVTANTILSILAADYPVEKLACYLSDDGGSLLTFEAVAEAASFAKIWVPFCRKHKIEPRNPEAYFAQKSDPLKNKVRVEFVRERRRVKREYDELKVKINALPDSIKRRSDAYNSREEINNEKEKQRNPGKYTSEPVKKLQKATWMSDGNQWHGTWSASAEGHTKGDHQGIIQIMLVQPAAEPVFGEPADGDDLIDTSEVDTRVPMLVYVSREKRPGVDHNKKAGAMNALVRASAIISNAPFVLNLDCDHYIYNSLALREGMCFMLDRGGDKICYVQFPQRFEGIDPNDRYANHNTVFFDVSMRALDGLQGPMYVGTGCIFRRIALYGFSPPRATEHHGWFKSRKLKVKPKECDDEMVLPILDDGNYAHEVTKSLIPQRFGNSEYLMNSIPVAEFGGRLLHDFQGKGCQGRPSGSLSVPRECPDGASIEEAIRVISCFYEDKTEWGQRVGWIYGSITEDVVTGYRMHNRGWRSVYCVTSRDAFRGTAPINLTDRLNQVLRWATGSVEIFFSKNNALFASPRMKILQRVAYLNVGMYPFTSAFLIVYCILPALSLFTGKFIVQSLSVNFLVYLLAITVTLCMLAVLEVRWSGINLHDWWRNEQFWLIGGTSAHPAAVVQGLLKVIAGINLSFTLTSKPPAAEDGDDEFAELYEFRYTHLMIPPITIILLNILAIVVGVFRTVNSMFPQWSKLLGGVFFSFWVLSHLYPFAKGLMGKKGKIPTIVYIWSVSICMAISLLCIYGPKGNTWFVIA